MKTQTVLAGAIAATLGSSGADAAVITAVLQSVTSYSTAGSRAANLGSSTATWSYDSGTNLLSQTGGTFNARYTVSATSTLFRHSITGLAIGGGSSATASSYLCTEGNFGGNVGASLCGNYNFGANYLNESNATWGPGTAASRTVSGDDVSLGAQQTISDYNSFVELSWVGTTLTLSNATATSGYTWVLQTQPTPPPTPAPGFSVVLDEYGIASSISNLDILGTRYNVNFGCYDCTLGPGTDLFLGNRDGAIAAADAINGALQAAGAGDVRNGIQQLYGDSYYTVAYGSGNIVSCRIFFCPDEDGDYWYWTDVPGSSPAISDSYAIFSLAAVPVPAAAWLFGGALLALGGMRRQQRLVKFSSAR